MTSEAEAVAEACRSWNVEPISMTELGRGENLVFRLDLRGGERRVLRVHRPGYNTLDQLECEVEWVRSLCEAGLPVPIAIATETGPHYTTVEIEGTDHHVGMIEWVDGEPLRGNDPAPSDFRTIGELAARIRVHSQAWPLPPSFDRRRWDGTGLVGDAPLWGRFWEADGLADDRSALFAECRDSLADELGSLSTGAERFGLIHADLHLGNLMADRGRITVIDFDDSGFGWFAYELAVALSGAEGEPYYDRARARLLDGYRAVTEFDPSEEASIDTFMAIRAVILVGWLDARKDMPHYAAVVDEVHDRAADVASRYLATRG